MALRWGERVLDRSKRCLDKKLRKQAQLLHHISKRTWATCTQSVRDGMVSFMLCGMPFPSWRNFVRLRVQAQRKHSSSYITGLNIAPKWVHKSRPIYVVSRYFQKELAAVQPVHQGVNVRRPVSLLIIWPTQCSPTWRTTQMHPIQTLQFLCFKMNCASFTSPPMPRLDLRKKWNRSWIVVLSARWIAMDISKSPVQGLGNQGSSFHPSWYVGRGME